MDDDGLREGKKEGRATGPPYKCAALIVGRVGVTTILPDLAGGPARAALPRVHTIHLVPHRPPGSIPFAWFHTISGAEAVSKKPLMARIDHRPLNLVRRWVSG